MASRNLSYTRKSLEWAREQGFMADLGERKVPSKNRFPITKDLFGFIDIVALEEGIILGIQATSQQCMAARAKKILGERSKEALAWLQAGGKIEIWGWKKYKKPVNRRYWRPTVWHVISSRDSKQPSLEVVKEPPGEGA